MPNRTTTLHPPATPAPPARDAVTGAGRFGSLARRRLGLFLYGALGTLFGVILTRAEILSWFRIQEMFRFHSFHMYGIIGSAVAVAALSLALIRRQGRSSATGQPIVVPPKRLGRGVRYVGGGITFGVGWGLTGACPGPLLALVGNGVGVFAVAVVSAVAGVWTYGHVRPRLPH